MIRTLPALVAGMVSATLLSATPCTAEGFVSCTQIEVQVVVGADRGPIAGTLCVPPRATRLQVLVPGSTYSRVYWDFPHPSGSYSYVAHANGRGEATLALDRLGTGGSWHPPSAQLTYTSQVEVLRQVIGEVRAGQLGMNPRSIVLLGHSYGGYIALGAAGTGADVDAVIATGATHSPLDYAALTASPAVMRPAALDPAFAGHPAAEDLGYLTTWPGVRAMFYVDAEPEIIALDEQHKDLAGAAEVSPATATVIEEASRAIGLPVLVLVGADDVTSCLGSDCTSAATLAATEREHFGPNAQVHAAVVPGAGHNLILERSRVEAWREIGDFLAAVPHHGHR